MRFMLYIITTTTLFIISPIASAQTCRYLFLTPSAGETNLINPEFKDRLTQFARVAHKRGYTTDPIVVEIREWMSTLTKETSDLSAGEMILFGEMYRKKSTLFVHLPSIKADGALDIGLRPRGLNIQFGKAIYGILLGLNDAVRKKKGIENIHIIASEIYNLELIKMLESYGFVFTREGRTQSMTPDPKPWFQYELNLTSSDLSEILR